jgi:hypothetical protein
MKIPEMTRGNQILLLLALIVIAIPSYFIYDYTQHNPKFCTTCHLMTDAYDTWEGSAMHDLTCHECHVADMVTNIQHMVDVLTKDPQVVVKPAEIDNELCEECHVSEDPQWLQVVNTDGHKVHFFGNGNHADCIDCHGMELHVFRPPEEGCQECHDESRVHAAEEMDATCVTCHDFLANGNGDHFIPSERDDCITCHFQMEETSMSLTSEAHLESSCTSCHNPHEEEVAEDCSKCHNVDEGLHEVPAHSDCTSCHVPHVEVDIRETCVSCHVAQEEHFAPADCTGCHN